MRRAVVLSVLILSALSAAMPAVPTAEAAAATWTFMVYLDADNNLEQVGVDDFLEMASVGSTSDVNIVVQFDRPDQTETGPGYDGRYGDWSTAKRFLVSQGMLPTPAEALSDIGEVNMADPGTLVGFLFWAMTNYPAEHYFLDLWDHGIGWAGVIKDNGVMRTTELAGALETIYQTLGKIDIIGNDACRMTVEIDYQLRHYADYFVGSEKDEPLAGWPYDDFLSALVADPSMSPSEVGTILTDVYVASYYEQSLYSVTLSVIESAALTSLASATARFVKELNGSLPLFQKELLSARDATEGYEGGAEFDLYDFAREVHDAIPSKRVKDAASGLMSEVLRAVVYESHWDNPSPVNGYHAADAQGLSVWFPVQVTDDRYHDLNWSEVTGWGGFLLNYRDGVAEEVSVTSTISPTDFDGDGALDGVELTVEGVPGGTFAVDAYQGSIMVATAGGAMGSSVQMNLPEGSVMDLSLYSWDSDATLLNYTEIENVLEVPLVFSGHVLDELGNPLAGAAVTVGNNRTGGQYSTLSDASGQYVVVVPTGEYAPGDSLTLEADLAGTVRTVSVRLPDRIVSLEVDFILKGRSTGDDGDSPALWVVGLFLIEAVFLAGAFFIFYRSRVPR